MVSLITFTIALGHPWEEEEAYGHQEEACHGRQEEAAGLLCQAEQDGQHHHHHHREPDGQHWGSGEEVLPWVLEEAWRDFAAESCHRRDHGFGESAWWGEEERETHHFRSSATGLVAATCHPLMDEEDRALVGQRSRHH